MIALCVLSGRPGLFTGHLRTSTSLESIIFQRRVHTTTSNWSRARPWKETQSPIPKQPLYKLPELVVQLDAEDNPHVRVYDEEIAAKQKEEWRKIFSSVDALEKRLAEFEEDSIEALKRMEATAAAPNRWRVLDSDIWAASLSSSSASERESEEQMQKLLHQNGITPRIATDPGTIVDLLFHRRALAKSRDASNEPAPSGQDGAVAGQQQQPGGSKFARAREAVVRDLASCESIGDVQRLLTLTAQTHWGCIIVGQLSHRIAERLAQHLAAPKTQDALEGAMPGPPQQISTLLLNLSYAFASKKVAFRPPFYLLGLKAATLSGEPVAMRHLFKIGLKNITVGKPPDEEGAEPWLLVALQDIQAALETSLFDGRRTELFTLLTSQGPMLGGSQAALDGEASLREAVSSVVGNKAPGRVTGSGSISEPFLLGSAVAPAVRDAYLGVLAELGCVRTLWEELRQASSQSRRMEADLLVRAVLRYGEYVVACPASREGDAVDSGMEEKKTSTQLDLAMLNDYEKREASRHGSTQAPLPRNATASRNFREAVGAAFAQEIRKDMLDAVGHILDSQVRLGVDTGRRGNSETEEG